MKHIPSVAGVLSAVCLAAMVLLLLTELVLRPFGVQVPSADDFTALLMVAVAYFGFVYAHAAGVHVRVELLVGRLPERARRPVEIVSLLGATVVLGWLAAASARLVHFAWKFHDMADTIVPLPLWIPMSVVPLGLALFAVATAADAWSALRGGALKKSEGELEEALELVGKPLGGEQAQ